MFENFVIPDFLPAAPEMFLAIMAMTILMIDLFAKDARHSIAFWLAQLTLLGCAFIQVYTSTPGVVYTFSNTFVDDSLGDLLKIFVYLTMNTSPNTSTVRLPSAAPKDWAISVISRLPVAP